MCFNLIFSGSAPGGGNEKLCEAENQFGSRHQNLIPASRTAKGEGGREAGSFTAMLSEPLKG